MGLDKDMNEPTLEVMDCVSGMTTRWEGVATAAPAVGTVAAETAGAPQSGHLGHAAQAGQLHGGHETVTGVFDASDMGSVLYLCL